MKVIDAKGTRSKTVSVIDVLEGADVSASVAKKINEEVGEFLLEQIRETVAGAKSPVQGEAWPSLSKDYKKFKEQEGATLQANMELTGEMLDDLTFRASDVLEIGFFTDEAWKADGHNKFSGKTNNTPQRRFLPDEGQSFKREITAEVRKIVEDALLEHLDLKKKDFKEAETIKDVISIIEDKFPDEIGRRRLRDVIFRSPELLDLLDELDIG